MKNILISSIACATLAMSALAHADTAAVNTPSNNNYFDGFYIGAGLTNENFHNDYDADMKNVQIPTTGITVDNLDLDINAGSSILGADINAGYGKQMNRLYIGANLQTNFNFSNDNVVKINTTVQGQSISANYHSNMPVSFTAGPQIGYVIMPRVLTYIGAGVTYAKYSHGATGMGLSKTVESKWLLGLTPSIGAKIAINKHFIVDFNYSMLVYSTETKKYTSTVSKPLPFDSATVKFKPQVNTFTVNAQYHF